jgi:hypothetical protein
MDPATIATTAVGVALPYIADLGKEAAKSAAGEAGKSVWQWVKGKLTSEASKEAIKDLESDPGDAANRMALQAALTKHLKADPNALSELTGLIAGPVGLDINRFDALGVELGDITVTEGTGARFTDTRVLGTFKAGGIHVGDPSPKK